MVKIYLFIYLLIYSYQTAAQMQTMRSFPFISEPPAPAPSLATTINGLYVSYQGFLLHTSLCKNKIHRKIQVKLFYTSKLVLPMAF